MLNIVRFSAILLAVALGGCVPVDLSQLTTRYDSLLQRKSVQPKSQPSSKDVDIDNLQQREEIETGLNSVAADALKIGEKPDVEVATRIVAYRLATLAAWQAGDNGTAEKSTYSSALRGGNQLCDRLKAPSVAPRDCAILAYLTVLRLYEKAANTFNAGVKSPAYASMGDDLIALRDAQPDLLGKIVGGEAAYSGIAPTTQDYFRKVAFASACLSVYVMWRTDTLSDSPANKVIKDTARARAASFSKVLVAAKILTDEQPDWYRGSEASSNKWAKQPPLTCPR